MSKYDATHQNSKVYMPQGGDRIAIDSDGYFNVDGSDITGKQLYDMLYTANQKITIANSAGVLSTINLPSEYRLINFSLATAASNASAWLTSDPTVGQQLLLVMNTDNSVASVFISTSGCSIVGNRFVDVSSLSLQQSAASNGFIHLHCFSAGEWTVVQRNGATAERSSS